jgi:hypothetical protein
MKKEFSEAQKNAVKKNLEKARAARARKKQKREKAVTLGFDASDMINGLTKLMNTLAVRMGTGEITKNCCVLCERDYIPSVPNLCPCQDGWRILEELEKLNGREERGESGPTNVDSGLSEAVVG